ncbi:hypothetical protein HBI56_101420 [Parastagonospora nodorum]|nr:hypothetical protein HBH53_179040 [Parastagonospora nodorum]KAH3959311.1 hypothetical protein HBH51_201390 [Parastagonospora nodorum]KAH4006306.1 hypothetical protein HBI10_022650 [Parastagonospora nodorum]KAH4011950.1 hypothetical protein HBI13_193010 [Parastagonospora nodorum]KAH4038882.1 hypothetical protein HBI09_041070 [Parastagonospora nodorum]
MVDIPHLVAVIFPRSRHPHMCFSRATSSSLSYPKPDPGCHPLIPLRGEDAFRCLSLGSFPSPCINIRRYVGPFDPLFT